MRTPPRRAALESRTPRSAARPPPWLLLTLAFAAGLVVSSVLFPAFRAPDERAHIDMSRWTAQRLDASASVVHAPDEERFTSAQVHEAAARTGLVAPPGELPPLPAGAATPRRDRPPFAALAPDVPGDLRNQMTQHPPGYYVLAGVVSSWLESPRPQGVAFDLQIVALRLLSALLFLPLPAAAALAARRLGAGGAAAGVAALLPLGVPMVSHIGAAVNNDALLVFAGAVATPLLLAAAVGERSWPATAGVAVLGGLALLAKGFGLLVPLWAGMAYAAGARRGTLAPALAHGAVAAGGALLLGGWWWVRNLLVLGEVQPHHAPLADPPLGFEPDWGWWVPFALHRFVRRFWIEPDTIQDVWRWEWLATAALVALIGIGLRAAVRRGLGRPALVALAPAAMATGLLAVGTVDLYRSTAYPAGIQGRYVYLGIAGLGAVAALAVSATAARRWLAVAGVAAGVVALQAWAWLAALDFYWGTPGDGLGESARAMLAWSPLPPAVVVVAAASFWVLLAAATVRLVAAAAGEGRAPGEPGR